jgi:glycosyltransferase involved in cell wall biosynthesis
VTPKSGALLAAFDHGCCVVATLPEGDGPLRDGEHLVRIEKVRDGAAVAAALRRALNEPGLAERVRVGGRAFAEPHAWPAIAAAHLDVYGEVLAR